MKGTLENLVRRSVDVLLAACGLLALAPILVFIMVRIKLDSPGPAMFCQARVGRHGRLFTIYKFRTMRVDSGDGPLVTAAHDSRVTHVGARLRRTKLDELPQLLNVLKGDMSLVGPRPEVPQYVAKWPTETKALILAVRPGITDPVTLSLRDEELILAMTPDPVAHYETVLAPAKLADQAEYVARRTLASDARVLAQTVWSLRGTE